MEHTPAHGRSGRRLASVGALTALALGLGACSSASTGESAGSDDGVPETVRWAQIGDGKAEPATIARFGLGDIDISERLGGAEVEYQPGFTASLPVIEAMQAGEVDFSFATSTAVIYAVGADIPIVPLAAYPLPKDEVDILVPGDSDIETAEDLVGKTVADQQGTTSTYSLSRYLGEAGLSLDDVDYSNLNITDAAASFTGGSVDAWISWQPQAELVKERTGARALEGVETYDWAFFVATQEFVDSYPEAAAELVRAARDAQRWIEADPATVVEQFDEIGGFGDDPLESEVYEQLVVDGRLSYSGAGELSTVTGQTAEEVQAAADEFTELGIYPDRVNVHEFLTDPRFDDIKATVDETLEEN